jgi:hypothetical protein
MPHVTNLWNNDIIILETHWSNMHGTNLMLLYYSPPEGPPMKEPRIPPSWRQLIGKQLKEPAAPMPCHPTETTRKRT